MKVENDSARALPTLLGVMFVDLPASSGRAGAARVRAAFCARPFR